MAQVTVTIDGKAYRMACEEGQETHLLGLAENFDRYVTHLKSQFGEIGDLRLTVMAAIMIMDELSEAKKVRAKLENEIENLRQAGEGAAAASKHDDEMMADLLSELTNQVRSISSKLDMEPAK